MQEDIVLLNKDGVKVNKHLTGYIIHTRSFSNLASI